MFKVLIVDDEELVRRGIAMEVDWKSLDCMVVCDAANGADGIEAVHKYNPDIIITDIRMPRLDGLDMVRILREEGNEAQVIFLTAYGDFTYAQSAIKLYAADYLLKPFEDGELEEAVLRIVEKLKGSAGGTETDKQPMLKKGDKSKYVMEAIEYIAAHYSDKELSIEAVAEYVGISDSHLSHLFKKETEYTLANYIIQYRIGMAAKLLKDCRYKVYEVGDMVGYRDITYFSSTFKKIMGMSPSEYQDRNR